MSKRLCKIVKQNKLTGKKLKENKLTYKKLNVLLKRMSLTYRAN